MTRILIDEEVPDGDNCKGCKHYSKSYGYCGVFEVHVAESGWKLPQCRGRSKKYEDETEISKAERILNMLRENGFNIMLTTEPVQVSGGPLGLSGKATGCQLVQPEKIDIEDDGSITFVVRAWR